MFPIINFRQLRHIEVCTPQADKYKNDCLHPCVRYIPSGFAGYKYWMVQSPYYCNNEKIENPILFHSNKIEDIGKFGVLVAESPVDGYNSDPSLFYDDDVLYVFWREWGTPLCREIGACQCTVGVSTKDGVNFSSKKVYLTNMSENVDMEQAPVLIKWNGEYRFYATWYQYNDENGRPCRRNRGIAIWSGTSLVNPNFTLFEKNVINTKFVLDKWKRIALPKADIIIPGVHKFDLWHFDLLTYKNKVFMVASEENKGNIILAISTDGVMFETFSQSLVGTLWQSMKDLRWHRLYKPTAIIKDNVFYVFVTSKNKDTSINELFYCPIDVLFKKLFK